MGIELLTALRPRKLLIQRNDKSKKSPKNAKARYTPGTRNLLGRLFPYLFRRTSGDGSHYCRYLPQVIAIHKSFIVLLSKYNVNGGFFASVIAAGNGLFFVNDPIKRFPINGFLTSTSFFVPL